MGLFILLFSSLPGMVTRVKAQYVDLAHDLLREVRTVSSSLACASL